MNPYYVPTKFLEYLENAYWSLYELQASHLQLNPIHCHSQKIRFGHLKFDPHGDRILDDQIGFFGNDNGWDLVVDDLLAIHIETNTRFPNIPKILLGHSMGS